MLGNIILIGARRTYLRSVLIIGQIIKYKVAYIILSGYSRRKL